MGVEGWWGPTLKRGDSGGRETTPIHTLAELEEASEAAGAWVRCLPTYSPELKPIALCGAKVTSRWRSLTPRTLPDLREA